MQNKKWISILVAIVVSIGLWLYVVTVENPVKEIELHNIPVSFVGQEVLREDYNLIITESNAAGGVSLTFSGKLADLSKLQEGREELQLNISVTHLRNAQSYSLSYDISDLTLPSSASSQDFTLNVKVPNTITVTLQKMTRASVPVRVLSNVTTEEGYLTGRLTQNYNDIIVEGPEEIVDQIEYAQVILERENVEQTINTTLPFALIDLSGEIVESDTLTCEVDEIEVSLPILMYKDVPLEAPLIEGGGVTTDDCDVDIEPKSIRLSGDPTVLETVNSIKLSNTDLSSLMTNSESVTKSIVIPAGCTSVNGEQEAVVSIEIKNKAIRQIRIPSDNFQYSGVPDDMTVNPNTSRLLVTIRANKNDIELISEENLRVVADFSALTLGTNMDVPVLIYVDGFDGAGTIGREAYTINVDVVPKETGVTEIDG